MAEDDAIPSEQPTTGPDEMLEGPRQIGSYRIVRKIGEGGMGEVYEAVQEHPVRRAVALKVIKFGMDSKQVVARFESERQALALMNHPNIARVLEAGATEQGRPYFAMELVKGVPITKYCDTHGLGARERLRLFMEVCDGVQHAHQKGIIHRDLKPSNVLVEVHSDKPVPKIIDFGVAKATGQRLTEQTVFTEFGQMVGTPEYMSPEQAEMTGLDVDTRADVYSLGVLLYELLVGELPFDGRKLRQQGFDELRRRIREDDPPKPSLRVTGSDRSDRIAACRGSDPISLSRLLRHDLDWIVMKALEKDRTRRYPSASHLGADIERHLKDQPVEAGPPSTVYRLQKFVRRHKVGTVVGGATLFLLAAVAVIMTIQANRIARERDRANQEAETARQVSEFLEGLFAVSDPNEALGSTITAREILDKGAERIRNDLADQPAVQARLMETMGNVYRKLGLYDDAEPLLHESVRLRESNQQEVGLAGALNSLASLYEEQGDFLQAEELFRRSLTIVEQQYGPQDQRVATAVNNLAKLVNMRGRLDEAEALYQRALHINREAMGPEHPSTVVNMGNLAVLYRKLGRYDEAEQMQRRVLEIAEKTLGPEHPTTTTRLVNLGALYEAQGKYDEAEPLLERALAIDERVLGAEHPYVATDLRNLGTVYLRQGKYQRAQEVVERALAIDTKQHGDQHPSVADDVLTLAQIQAASGQLDEAEASFLRAQSVLQRSYGEDHPSLIALAVGLGSVYTDQERYTEAEPLLRRAYETLTASFGPDNPQVDKSRRAYARLLRRLGREAEADRLSGE